MQRRKFMGLLPWLGAGSIAPAALLHASGAATSKVQFAIKGFSCVTCAVGLETLLQREHGVVSAKVSYVPATAIVEYHLETVDAAALQSLIEQSGFAAAVVS